MAESCCAKATSLCIALARGADVHGSNSDAVVRVGVSIVRVIHNGTKAHVRQRCNGHGQMRRTDGVGNGHHWGLRYGRWKGIWRLQSRGPGTVCDCQQTRKAAMAALDKGRSCKQRRAKKETPGARYIRAPALSQADPHHGLNSNLFLSQLAAGAERSFWYSDQGTAFRTLSKAPSEHTNIICLPA